MNMEPSWTLVREKAEELKNRILSKFPSVDVEYVDWRDLTGSQWRSLEHRGFPAPHPDFHAYILIRGDLETAEEAATLADNEVARISEESGVELQVRKPNHVFCKKSTPLKVWHYVPGEKLQPPTHTYLKEDKRGMVLLCFFDEIHEHDWGNVKPQW